MTGVVPSVPGLLGLPRDYLIGQFGGWKTGQRKAAAPDCMARIGERLTPADIEAVATWLSAQPVPADAKPVASIALPLPMPCGSAPQSLELAGGLMPMADWYAPSLTSAGEASVADWETQHIVDLLKTGVSPRGSAMGPMAEVVFHSTQYLSSADLHAMAVYLKGLPQTEPAPPQEAPAPGSAAFELGRKLYEQQCAQCHGEQGQGAPGAYPPLAGNRAVEMDSPTNVIRAVMDGGLSAGHCGSSAPLRDAAVRPDAGQCRDRCGGVLHPGCLG